MPCHCMHLHGGTAAASHPQLHHTVHGVGPVGSGSGILLQATMLPDATSFQHALIRLLGVPCIMSLKSLKGGCSSKGSSQILLHRLGLVLTCSLCMCMLTASAPYVHFVCRQMGLSLRRCSQTLWLLVPGPPSTPGLTALSWQQHPLGPCWRHWCFGCMAT